MEHGKTKREARALTKLAAPILLANVFWMLIGTVDVVMLGRWSSEAVAAALLANVWVHLTQMLGMGLVMGIDPLVTQGHGARDREALGRALQRGILVAVFASLPVIGLRFLTAEFLASTRHFAEWVIGDDALARGAGAALNLEGSAALDAPAERYALAQSFAAPAFLIYIAMRQYLQGRGILKPALAVAAIGNVVNIIANRVLIYDLELGIVGAGLATGLTRLILCVLLLLIVQRARLLRGAWVPWDRASFDPGGIWRVLRYGIPVALHFSFEMGAFGASTLLAGILGVTATVAHGIAINVASMTFMVPLGIGLAATTRVGNLIGEGRHEDAQFSSYVALWGGALAMALLGAALFLGRNILPELYVPDDVAAVALAATILPIAAAFQVFDGVQVVGAGILRGAGSTLPAAVFNFLAWWVIALPVGAWFVLRRAGTIEHVWWALCLGLGVVAVMMVVWIRYRGPSRLGMRPVS